MPQHSADIQDSLADLRGLAFDVCPIALLTTDGSGVIRLVNRAAAELLRTPPTALTDRPLVELVAPGDKARLRALGLTASAARGAVLRLEEASGCGAPIRAVVLVGPQDAGGGWLWSLDGRPAAPGPEEMAPFFAGLIHEGRSILQRGQAALDRLAWRLGSQTEMAELLARLQRALDDHARLYNGVRDYAVPLALQPGMHDVAEICRTAWTNLLADNPDRDAQLVEQPATINPVCEVDPRHLGHAFRLLLQSALAGCDDPVRIALSACDTTWGGEPAIEVSLHDNGPALAPEQRPQFFAPFGAPKGRRCGLDLSTARKIVEAHGGRVDLGPAEGAGVQVLVALPRRMA